MARTGITLGSVLIIVIFVSETLAKPQSDHDQLKEIRAEYFSYPGTDSVSDYTEARGPGSFSPNASVPFQRTISQSRRSESINSWSFNRTTTLDINALYLLVAEAKTWTGARKFCQERDGHLAIINSIGESEIIAEINTNEEYPHSGSADTSHVLIGFHQPYTEYNTYETIDGRYLEQAGFAEWASGKPDRDEEKCGAANRDGKLSSVPCDTKYAFVCEVPLLNNVPGDSSQNFSQRDGQKESPAKTCTDLFVAYPDKPSGEYWIDPNEGDISDAILVYCDAEERATCVTPELSRSPNISDTGYEREVWLSEIDDELQITYTASANQITALQLLSRHAEQNITYHCIKSIGYFDSEDQTTERGLKLLAWNDVELEPRGSRHFRYDVISDGCKDRLDEWNKTVITYRTNQPARLPVLDVGLRDVGKPGQQFSVEIGDVCFN